MNQFEYMTIENHELGNHEKTAEFNRQLNAAGWEGWELVSTVHITHPVPGRQFLTAYLKRPVSEQRRQELSAATLGSV